MTTEQEQNQRITYGQLSIWLKIFVVLGWITIVINILGFIIGFFGTA